MKNPQFIPKSFYIILVLVGIGFAFADHLASPSLGAVDTPASIKGACAPCGAPCIE